ncbi:MAG: hypothetical protein RLT05_04325 [Bauldia litoralis]
MATVALLAGCGTFGAGPQQAVYINTGGVTASCVVQSKSMGRIRTKAPGQVAVRRSPDPLRISCFAEGYKPGGAVVPSKFDALAGGNRYPDRVRIVLTKLDTAPTEDDLDKRKRSKIRTTG